MKWRQTHRNTVPAANAQGRGCGAEALQAAHHKPKWKRQPAGNPPTPSVNATQQAISALQSQQYGIQKQIAEVASRR